MSSRVLLAVAALLALLLGGGCGIDSRRAAPGFDPRVPLKVGVLPFVDRSSGDSVLAIPFTTAIDVVPFLSDPRFEKARAATVLRAGVEAELHRSALDPVDGVIVDSLIAHRKLDAMKAYDGDRAAMARLFCAALGADAVLMGEVTAWDRDFYVVESTATVGLRLELREAAAGAILFESEVRDWSHAGITKIPVSTDPAGGAQAVVGNALKGLAVGALGVLSRDVARAALVGLTPGDEEARRARAPEVRFLGHDGRAGLAPGDEVAVVVLGSPGARASARLGPDGPLYPLTESAPGVYRGTLLLPPAREPVDGTIEARLVGEALRVSTMTVRAPALERRMLVGATVTPPMRKGGQL